MKFGIMLNIPFVQRNTHEQFIGQMLLGTGVVSC